MDVAGLEIAHAESICDFGYAKRDITPPVGMYHRMWGAAAQDVSTGVHRPLELSVCLFRAERVRRILVALDHCLLRRQDLIAFRAGLNQRCNIDDEELLVTFSHTHGAGLLDSRRSDKPGGEHIAPYLDSLTEQAVGAVHEALSSVLPAVFTYGSTTCRMAAQRDFYDEQSEQFVCGTNPEGDWDSTVMVIRISDQSEKIRAVMVNYACHPTTLAWENSLISPDYPGALRETVSQSVDAPCVFLLGVCGDVGPVHGYVGDPAVADRNGRAVGYAALTVLELMKRPLHSLQYGGPKVSGATLGLWTEQPRLGALMSLFETTSISFNLKYKPQLMREADSLAELSQRHADESAARQSGDSEKIEQCRAMVERMERHLEKLGDIDPGDSHETVIHLWKLGGAVWVLVPGEPYNLLQAALRRAFPKTSLVVMGLTGSYEPGYMPDRASYGKGIYQETVSVLEAGTLELITERLIVAIKELLK